jgi:hypothetical protein
MKKKLDSNKPTKTRMRRSNLTYFRKADLAGFSKEHLRTIRRISDQSRVPIDQVLSDVIENGLITVMPMYESMIEFRKSRETKLKSMFEPKQNEFPFSEATGLGSAEEPARLDIRGEDTGQGEGNLEGDGEFVHVEYGPQSDFVHRPVDASEQSGHESSADTYLGSDDSNGDTLTGH